MANTFVSGGISAMRQFRGRGSFPEQLRPHAYHHYMFKTFAAERKARRNSWLPSLSPVEGSTGLNFVSDPLLLPPLFVVGCLLGP